MNSSFYVYIYKDKKQNIQYVGYGKNSKRATSHQSKTHKLGIRLELRVASNLCIMSTGVNC